MPHAKMIALPCLPLTLSSINNFFSIQNLVMSIILVFFDIFSYY